MSDYTELKHLAGRVLNDRRFCGDENHKALAEGVLALIAENARLQESHEQICTNYNQVSYASEERGKQIDQLKAELEKVKADRSACWDEFKVQGRRLDEIKAENKELTEKYEAARDRKNSIAALKIENDQLKEDLVAFKGGISALGGASKRLTFCARTTGGTAGPDQGLMDACDAVEKSLSLVGVSRAIDYMEELKSELAGLRTGFDAQNEVIAGLRKDAERYQWLRVKQTFIWLIQDWFPSDAEFTDVDAEIDAAMGKGVDPKSQQPTTLE